MMCENTKVRILIGQFFVDLDASTKQFSRPQELPHNAFLCNLPGYFHRTTGSLADTLYTDSSD